MEFENTTKKRCGDRNIRWTKIRAKSTPTPNQSGENVQTLRFVFPIQWRNQYNDNEAVRLSDKQQLCITNKTLSPTAEQWCVFLTSNYMRN